MTEKVSKTKLSEDTIPHDYVSPRWSQEILDCSMPMTFDTYSLCSFDCQYCFSYFQKSHQNMGYLERLPRSVDPEKVKRIFRECIAGNPTISSAKQFAPYIQQRKVMQWGGLGDAFDMYEKKYGITLQLLKFFDEIDYPLSFSTKSTWWTEDERYLEIFRKHQHNWHVKVSIISLNQEKCKFIEKGVPAPLERIAALQRLHDIGIKTTLRLRPYIYGLSNDWKDLINLCADAGIISVSSEFFCLEARADQATKARYKIMSNILGYDMWDFYKEHSPGAGYKRLNRQMKIPIYEQMKTLCKKRGIVLAISDAHCRDLNVQCNCCGVPPDWNSQTAQFNGAILIAKQKGKVYWKDIAPGIEALFGHFKWHRAEQFNTNSNRNRAMFNETTMAQWIHYLWNHPERATSPAGAYGGILKPVGIDTDGNQIYALGVCNHGNK